MAGQGPARRSWSANERAITPATTGRIQGSWTETASVPQEVVGDAQRLFVRSQDLLQALDPATGTERWHVAAPGRSVPGLIGDGVVVAVDGPLCTLRRLAASSGAPQASATIGYAYGADATTRSCTAARSVLTENGRVAVSTASSATFAVPGCGAAASNQLWGAATTVTVLDDTLHPLWTATDATIGCGTPPATSPVAPFGEVTRTEANYVVPQGTDVVAYPRACSTPCAPSWTRTFTDTVDSSIAALPGNQIAVPAVRLTVLDAATGAVRWTAEQAGGRLGIAATDAYVFAPALSELDAYPVAGCGTATCAPAWHAPLGNLIPLFRPIVVGDVVVVPLWEGPGRFVDARGCGAATCTTLAGQAPSLGTQGAVSVINGRIYATGEAPGVLTYVVGPPT